MDMLGVTKEQRLLRASLISKSHNEGNMYVQLAPKAHFSTVSAILLAELHKR